MVRAVVEVQKDSAEGRGAFFADDRTRKVLLLDLVYLVESASKVSPAFRKENPSVGWERMSALRNQGIVHAYTEIDLNDVWAFIRDEVPRIGRRLRRARFPKGGSFHGQPAALSGPPRQGRLILSAFGPESPLAGIERVLGWLVPPSLGR
jgi:uncharacterized protein with HEPN domain